jgi:hypothetical protein
MGGDDVRVSTEETRREVRHSISATALRSATPLTVRCHWLQFADVSSRHRELQEAHRVTAAAADGAKTWVSRGGCFLQLSKPQTTAMLDKGEPAMRDEHCSPQPFLSFATLLVVAH